MLPVMCCKLELIGGDLRGGGFGAMGEEAETGPVLDTLRVSTTNCHINKLRGCWGMEK